MMKLAPVIYADDRVAQFCNQETIFGAENFFLVAIDQIDEGHLPKGQQLRRIL